MKKQIAQQLLSIGAVELRPNDPFTWASGVKSPIYCDNRLTMSYPEVRKAIADGLAETIRREYPDAQVIAGTATAGIPHAAWVAERLDLPMVYVRSKPKGHGQSNLIEGKIEPGQKAVVIEDLISKGGSVLQAAQALQDAGFEVAGIAAIFTYGLPQAEQAIQEAGFTFHTLTDFPALVQQAREGGAIAAEDLPMLSEWHEKLKAGALTS
ncbi:orotate phosphoribosyltransferase [Planococcus sp. CP5-4]|uniref:orotate phosphoribosyltransferase n=1 Tax=unclassified Planococcus (in: firmicutes) TaxID=2662419 RepID=UPI001C24F4BA|nr:MULTISPECIES: orotate phosphoribosyltransferase [unclassified Planococcus (in: firmicutes)]MBU9672129.1 orotate phosphoribosyltransferase [Planococcus sp. CP5-4_YE]MBV0907692.1 orotate phosphoribosyltransferase [Planococcus sp. CP5-4_UN]MBW6062859.1 orotate phosphoribosyltransferase [Planococcus sp. CP5-4]